MTFEQAVENLVKKYGKYGVTEDMAHSAIKECVIDGETVEFAYNVTRIAWADAIQSATGEDVHEYFTIEDIMSITGETREECVARTEKMLQEVEEIGGNPDDYAIKAEPSVFYFPHGLK